MAQFISHDGQDANGVRAEVSVETGTGKITQLTPSPSGTNVSLVIRTPGLTHPQPAWVKADDPVFPEVQKAYDTQSDIQYRIESQRKPKIDRATPLAELRSSMEIAKINTNKILANINGQATKEAVTNPDEDPAPGGRIPAGPVAAKEAPAPTQQSTSRGNSSSHANSNTEEAPPFAEYNFDHEHSYNYGSYSAQAVFGAELFVRKQLMANNLPTDADTMRNYMTTILDIVSKLQGYLTRKKPNRMASSNTRVRSLVYDTIEHFHPFPVDGINDAWVTAVGRLTQERIQLVTSVIHPTAVEAPVQTPSAPVQEQKQAPVAPVESKKAASAPVEHQAVTEHDVEAAMPVERPVAAESSAGNDMLASAKPAVQLFPQTDISGNGDEKAGKDEADAFRELCEEMNAPTSAIIKLLSYTFGANVKRIYDVPKEVFEEFLDFYLADDENFTKALEYVETISG